MSAKGLKNTSLSALVVDDDSIARGYLKSALRALECREVQEVSKADQVLPACLRFRPDIVFLDIDLAGSNGLELIGQILQKRSGQYIVMVSAHSTVGNVKQSLESGARGFIVKPFTMAKIREALLNALKIIPVGDLVEGDEGQAIAGNQEQQISAEPEMVDADELAITDLANSDMSIDKA